MRRRLLFILFACLIAIGASTEEIPFEVKEGFLWVQVQVAQASEPLNCILDSGAEVSTVNVQAAERLGLKGGRRVSVVGVGNKGSGRWPVRLVGRAGDVSVPTEFLVTDLCEVQQTCRCRVDGLLGADFFWGKVVQIDFATKTVRVLENAPEDTQGQRVPIRFRRKIMQVPIGIGREGEQWLRLDTGCTSAVERVSKGKTASKAKVSIGLAEMSPSTARETVCVGESCFENVPVGVHGRAFFASEDGLLGLGLLGRFEQVTIDAKRGELVLSGGQR